jgi:hypothetical protein
MAADFQLAAGMVTLGAGAARAPSLLKMVVDDDRGLLATGCPAVPLLGQDDVGHNSRSPRPHRPAWRKAQARIGRERRGRLLEAA